jgi:hypothetical protein
LDRAPLRRELSDVNNRAILGGDERLLYSSVEDAAEKIGLTMLGRERQKELRDFLAARSEQFSAEHFLHQFRELVERFEPE